MNRLLDVPSLHAAFGLVPAASLTVLLATALPTLMPAGHLAGQLPEPQVLPMPDNPPTFRDYPAVERLTSYAPAFTMEGGIDDATMQWLGIEGVPRDYEPSFAGRYMIWSRGCGTECVAGALIDLQTGMVTFPAVSGGSGFSRRADSRLLIVNDPEYESSLCDFTDGARGGRVLYLALEDGELVEVHRSEFPCTAVVGGELRDPPALDALVGFARSQSDMRPAIVRYEEDRRALARRYDIPLSPVRSDRMRSFYQGWLESLASMDFDGLNHEGQIDYVLLRNRLEFELAMLDQEAAQVEEMAPLIPFNRALQELQEARRERIRSIDARATAETLDRVAEEVESATASLRAGSDPAPEIRSVIAVRAARQTDALRGMLRGWYGYFDGYDPLFSWWVPAPYERLQTALEAHAHAIRDRYVGDLSSGPVVGDPIGDEGLRAHLDNEMIPYTADELIAIAEAEFAWMEEELGRAAREMGYGDDWRAAQEAVKQTAVDPGEKPRVVLELEEQSVDFIEARDWITLPPLAHEVWRVEMMSPERQRIAPFFLGGEVIQISYPTDDMTHDEKLMSMRGNNPHFNRATVHHELIPGHHLQGFMTRRFNEHRAIFSTPFWGEGWALYWEMVLWEHDFPRGPEDRIGMLFWRMHRAARIIFSLSFHLERMTPQEAVDFLVERVGHERANAEAEVRRSFAGDYSPLYQAGYMLGGMQFRALYDELVENGDMTPREFHDAVLQGGRMPVEMVRARLSGQSLSRDHEGSWRFADGR